MTLGHPKLGTHDSLLGRHSSELLQSTPLEAPTVSTLHPCMLDESSHTVVPN